MSLDIGDALRSGIDDLTSEAGLLVVAVFLLYNFVSLVVNESFAQQLFAFQLESGSYSAQQQEVIESFSSTSPFALGVGLPLTVLLVVVLVLAGELVRYWAIRLFADPSETKTASATDRAVMAVALGGAVALLAFVFQTVLPVAGQFAGAALGFLGSLGGPVVGFVLVLVFVYLRQEIALNDAGYGKTVRNSVARLTDEPGSTVVLLLILGVIGFLAGLPGFVLGVLGFFGDSISVAGLSGAVLGQLIGVVLGALVQTFGVAVVTDAYLQLRASADEQLA